MEKDVLEAIQDNEEQIEELKTQIELIKSIDFTILSMKIPGTRFVKRL